MGTYQSKFTGAEIDGLLEQVQNGGGSSSSGDSTPVGNIISFMGTIAPDGYLTCDGTVLNITDYPKLASHFETQFGTKNHFGGDGTTTFAVPDLRNEFLRGYGDRTNDIGIHQDGTTVPKMGFTSTSALSVMGPVSPGWDNWANYGINNHDQEVMSTTRYYDVGVGGSKSASEQLCNGTVRPTNVAVLYCIKY